MKRSWRLLLLAVALSLVCVSAAPGSRSVVIVFAAVRGTSATWQVYSVAPDGAAFEQLTFGAEPSLGPVLSPDGTRIVFVRGYHPSDLWIMNTDGSQQHRLSQAAGMDEGSPAWSSDGTEIAFAVSWPVGKQGIWITGSDGKGPYRLTFHGESSPSWSPDGRSIAFGAGFDIYVMPVAGGHVTRLTDADHAADGYEPRWSPDGSRILFVADRPPKACSEPTDLWLMNADGSDPVQITDTSQYAEVDPTWISNSQIAYLAEQYGGAAEVRVSNVDGTNPHTIVGTTTKQIADADAAPSGC